MGVGPSARHADQVLELAALGISYRAFAHHVLEEMRRTGQHGAGAGMGASHREHNVDGCERHFDVPDKRGSSVR